MTAKEQINAAELNVLRNCMVATAAILVAFGALVVLVKFIALVELALAMS